MARRNRRRASSKNRSKQSPEDNSGEKLPKNDLSAAPLEKPPILIDKKELRDAALERAKNRPIRERIMSFFRREKKEDYKEIIINTEALERRVAMMENGILQAFDIERLDKDRMVGAIFKGKVQNLEAGLKAAFVNIGQEKNAFLHYWDMLPGANNDPSVEIVLENKKKSRGKNEAKSVSDIPRVFPIGSEIVVQITKAQIGTKGPRTTTNLSLPGRFLVLMPYAGQCGISRKIEDKAERKRLKRIIGNLSLREGMGVIIRTVGQNKPERFFVRDLHILMQQWDQIESRIKNEKDPCMLYEEPDLIGLTARDFLTDDVDRVQIDNREDYTRLIDTIQRISPKSKAKVSLFEEEIPIFQRFNIERQIEQTFMRCVKLPSGGEIVMEETEALVSIDINTGSHKGNRKDGKNFILQANLEAAAEVARQLRLRNLGGLVVVDFIDMKNRSDQRKVFQKMKASMSDDKAKHNVLPISELGILQITRQRHDESNSSGVYEPCPYCKGRGIVKSPRSISIEIQRLVSNAVRRIKADGHDSSTLKVFLHPSVLRRLRGPDASLLSKLEKNYGLQISFQGEESYHMENFKVVDESNGNEIR
ncbi:Rne/Rng family ribonuclease [Opitutales bacterium]|jgi:ribonuclease G|uniref:Rne/Rng family ribonuclease n=1 Tax=Candidatus Chordibacter forsetii TaxID=3381758 RepID=UPI00230AD907|nr:Rne/Rng family ribonuclease [Opitutales bacterium]MDA9110285.1 Rne/Rng family ribonuclease [bacterium]MDA8806873.1 Rne/Rng family ribonuclease [Opitutales bacterium]MDA8989036.1 Rne/Rng family ribonuclease [Opitutales bacterium]MDA9119013.1 Rne/Rng family ribonuclease [Opitutales bacterium]